ncbi:21881_t:CDS:2 [Entrophospora sp. SA101]|nr:21881_t:CDS:2 [Entrophospora sp. SA101]
MPTINQLVKNPRVPKPKKTKLLALKANWNSRKKKYSAANNPQKSGICKKIGVIKPRKPNSANRAYARIVLKNKKEITVYIPGEKHNLQEYSSVLISGGGAQDLPGVKYSVIRGRGDAEGVKDRKQGRSLYEITKNPEKHLIKLDIDGTSTNPDFATLNQKLKEVLQKLIKQGHKICFTTGRNYLSALPFYQEVGLDTFLVTYNGAYINNPSDENNKEVVVFHPIKNEIVKDILNEPIIKENICNVMIDHVGGLKKDNRIDLKTISTSDDIYYREIFFNNNSFDKVAKEENILQLLGKKDALQLVLEFPFPKDEGMFNEILLILRAKYSDAITFYFGMATQYNIGLHNVIAFGNDVNDIELVHSVGKGIVTADSNDYLKTYAYGITDFGMFNSDGVAKYLEKYFKLKK